MKSLSDFRDPQALCELAREMEEKEAEEEEEEKEEEIRSAKEEEEKEEEEKISGIDSAEQMVQKGNDIMSRIKIQLQECDDIINPGLSALFDKCKSQINPRCTLKVIANSDLNMYSSEEDTYLELQRSKAAAGCVRAKTDPEGEYHSR